MTKSDELFVEWLETAGLDIKPSYTIAEVARLLCCCQNTAYKMLAEGRVQAVRMRSGRNTSVRVPYPSLKELWKRVD